MDAKEKPARARGHKVKLRRGIPNPAGSQILTFLGVKRGRAIVLVESLAERNSNDSGAMPLDAPRKCAT